MGSQCVPQVVNVFHNMFPIEPHFSPYLLPNFVSLANIGTYVFFAFITSNLKSKKMSKKKFHIKRKCSEKKVQVENNM
jgi:hypothetical protein